jgi:hypothetical protein
LANFTEESNSNVVYTFNNSPLVTSYNNSPAYSSIKNDIVAWGVRGDSKLPIRYHLLIDNKPTLSNPGAQFTIITDEFGVKRAYQGGSTSCPGNDWR